MPTTLNYGDSFEEATWGATFKEVTAASSTGNIFICHATISDLKKIAEELTTRVTDRSWVVDLDDRARRAYSSTSTRTAEKLVGIFRGNLAINDKIVTEFGELMVSMGSAKALETVFEHRALPLAELWKPNLSQNEGFDFHTVCKDEIINFGEAKFSGSATPSSLSGVQADGFIEDEKHLMDAQHLGSLAGETATANLDVDVFGIVLAFSINAVNPLLVLRNALNNVQTYDNLKKAKNIYIVGVSYDSTN